MAETPAARPRCRLVLGIGNLVRGDDAAGRLVARALRGRVPGNVEVLEHDGEATGLLEHLRVADSGYLIDAAVSGAAPGTIRRFDCSHEPLPRHALRVSTHGFGPDAAIELARALGILPRRCIVYSIEAAAVGAGAGVSAQVRKAAETVAGRIIEELTTEARSREDTFGEAGRRN